MENLIYSAAYLGCCAVVSGYLILPIVALMVVTALYFIGDGIHMFRE